MVCSKNCCKVGEIIYWDSDDDIWEIIENNKELENYKAFNEVFEDRGNENYALPEYCVKTGHLDCLKTISKLPNFMYHSDLAICATEYDNLECLKFILEELRDVNIPDLKDINGPNCECYIKNIHVLHNGPTTPSNKWSQKSYSP